MGIPGLSPPGVEVASQAGVGIKRLLRGNLFSWEQREELGHGYQQPVAVLGFAKIYSIVSAPSQTQNYWHFYKLT